MDEVARAAGTSRDTLVRALEKLGVAECEAALDRVRLDEGSASDAVRRLVREIEPAAGLLAFRYGENQLWEEGGGEFRIDLTASRLTEALHGLIASCAWATQTGRGAPRDFTHMVVGLLPGGALRGEAA